MDAILVLFILIGVIGSVVKNARKTARKRPGQSPAARAPRNAPEKRAQPVAPPWAENFPPELREVLSQNRRKGANAPQPVAATPGKAPAAGGAPLSRKAPVPKAALANDAPSFEGKSPVYADGCVGGSLPHGPEAAPAQATLRKQAPSTRPILLDAASLIERRPMLTAAELRRAVITSEILARPLALRPRGNRP